MKIRTSLVSLLLGAIALLGSGPASAQSAAAPTITTQPASQTVAAGAKVTFSVTASGSDLSYRWFKEGRLILVSTGATLTFESATAADAGAYRVVVSNLAGAATSNSATLVVTGSTVPLPGPATAPAITLQPLSQIVTAGATATFSVTATGSGTLRYQWFKNGREREHAESATLTIASAQLQDAAVYTVRVSNSAGSSISSPASLSVQIAAGTILTAPVSATVKAGAEAKLSVTAAGTSLGYQWRFNGRPLKGATSATLTLANAGATVAGNYAVTITNRSEPVAAAAAVLTITTDARLTNIATRGHVGEDDEVLISGFVTRGAGTKKVLLRAVGPTLGAQFNVAGALAAPRLTLHRAGRDTVVIDSNNGWGGSTALMAAFAQVGAFPLPPTSADAALLATLDSGGYTATVTAPRGASGVALVEVYDADTGSPSAEVVNISTRALVGAEAKDTLIAGFAITGTTSNTVLIRGVGPSLGTLFGMRRALGASHVAVFDSSGRKIAANTVWNRHARAGGRDDDDDDDDDDEEEDSDKDDEIDDASDRCGAWRLPRGSHDSVLLLTLAPGVYTAHVTGANNASGIGLVEIFEVR